MLYIHLYAYNICINIFKYIDKIYMSTYLYIDENNHEKNVPSLCLARTMNLVIYAYIYIYIYKYYIYIYISQYICVYM